MNRRHFLIAALVFTVLPTQAARADYVDDVIDQLEDQGFEDIDVSVTLLGRTRIVATGRGGTRELILNARTGEVLRDVWIDGSGQLLPGIAKSGASDDIEAPGDGQKPDDNRQPRGGKGGDRDDD